RVIVSSRESRALPYSSVASTSTPALEAQTPTSQSAASSASSSRAAYGAPDAPVIPRKTCIPRDCDDFLLLALRGLEEGRQLPEPPVPERGEFRHRRARHDARRALQVVDLERDAEVSGADRRQVRRAEVRRAGAEVGVARRAAGLGEEPGARLRLLRQLLLLDPVGHVGDHLGGECLLGGRALPRQYGHR